MDHPSPPTLSLGPLTSRILTTYKLLGEQGSRINQDKKDLNWGGE